MMNKVNINKKLIDSVCKTYRIGECISQPAPCVGGLLHQIYQFDTEAGKFVIKFLNPVIINRPNRRERYRITERIAHELAKYIPIAIENAKSGAMI